MVLFFFPVKTWHVFLFKCYLFNFTSFDFIICSIMISIKQDFQMIIFWGVYTPHYYTFIVDRNKEIQTHITSSASACGIL